MFTRVVELTSKPGKSKELANAINAEALPILKQQRGFADEIVLVSDLDHDRVLALSFWETREDAERYQRQYYQMVHDTLRYLLDTEPAIRTFNVHTSISHKITAEKAA